MGFEVRVKNTRTGEEITVGTYGHIELERERAEVEVHDICAPPSASPIRTYPLPLQERMQLRAWDGIEKYADFVPVQKKYVWHEEER